VVAWEMDVQAATVGVVAAGPASNREDKQWRVCCRRDGGEAEPGGGEGLKE